MLTLNQETSNLPKVKHVFWLNINISQCVRLIYFSDLNQLNYRIVRVGFRIENDFWLKIIVYLSHMRSRSGQQSISCSYIQVIPLYKHSTCIKHFMKHESVALEAFVVFRSRRRRWRGDLKRILKTSINISYSRTLSFLQISMSNKCFLYTLHYCFIHVLAPFFSPNRENSFWAFLRRLTRKSEICYTEVIIVSCIWID